VVISNEALLTFNTSWIFADGFDSCTVYAWSGRSGNVSATTAAAYASTCGMAANITSNTPVYVVDAQPSNETLYRVRFYFNPHSLPMAKNDTFTIFNAVTGSNAVALTIQIKWTGSAYQIRVGIRLDNGQLSYTGWTSMSNAWHPLELYWKASSAPRANNGVLTLWMDGVQKATLTRIDNDTTRIETAFIGAVEGIDAGTRGVFYFDSFISNRLNYIGP
jgi:hypothetical protein